MFGVQMVSVANFDNSKIMCYQNSMSHDAVVGQLPVYAHVLWVGQGCGRDPVHGGRVRRAGFLEQFASGRHHVAV